MASKDFILIADDGTPFYGTARNQPDTYREVRDGDVYVHEVPQDRAFPATTEGLKDAFERAVAVRYQEVLDNRLDNPGCEATGAELTVLEAIAGRLAQNEAA